MSVRKQMSKEKCVRKGIGVKIEISITKGISETKCVRCDNRNKCKNKMCQKKCQ